MVLKVYVDIETLPPEKEAGVDEEVCQRSEEEFRRLALDGDYGRVLTVGIIVERDREIIHQGLFGRERQNMLFHLDEARTLRGFWKLMREFNPSRDLVIGHNVFFDLLFLYKRSIIQRVRPSVELSFARYRSQPIYDTMQMWNRWDYRKYITLDKLAKILGLESSKQQGIDGSKVYEHWCAGCHTEIAEYCMRDVRLVRDIYYRMIFESEGTDEVR
jgi:3'-5' exonuclease